MTNCPVDFRVVREPHVTIYHGCRLVDVTEPRYNLLERLVRWLGHVFSNEEWEFFHEGEYSYEFVAERVSREDFAAG